MTTTNEEQQSTGPETQSGERLGEPEQSSERHRKPRMTKQDVKQYVEWCFSPEIKDEIPTWSYSKISSEYEKATGRKLSSQFISAQKKKWVLVNGEICKRLKEPKP